jgi:hypothetical protein
MPSSAYVFPTLDDEPIVPVLSDKGLSTAIKSSDLKNVNKTTIQKKKEIEREKVDALLKEKEPLVDEQEAQTLNPRDYGNFTLLVVLCKFLYLYLFDL